MAPMGMNRGLSYLEQKRDSHSVFLDSNKTMTVKIAACMRCFALMAAK